MNRLLLFLIAGALVLTACERPAERPIDPDAEPMVAYLSFGEEVSEEGPALRPEDLDADPLAYHGQDVRVEGVIVEVCQRTGCWLALDNLVGDPVRVMVPRVNGEYAWTVPTDLGRLNAIVEGTVYADTLSVEDLRHFAEDAGRSPGQIAAIDQPQVAAHVVVRGMLVEEPVAPPPPAEEPQDVEGQTAAAPAAGRSSSSSSSSTPG